MQPPGALGPRTRDVGEMFGDALRHHRAHLGLLFGVAFVVQVPSLIVTFLGAPSTEYAAYLTPPGAVRATSLEAGWLLIAGLVALAVAPFSAGAIYRAAADVVAGRPPTVAAALNAVL
ncbi:MAG: hypothetical protein ACREPA_03965, partial [Candidatus Dormibacteraceae bacterium]